MSTSRMVEITLVAVLGAAAGTKTLQLLARSGAIVLGPAGNRFHIAGIVLTELLLAIWLLTGGATRLRSLCAIACFCIFAAVSSYEFLHAMPRCGCFGNVKVPPAVTAGFDIAAVAALWLTRPRGPRWGTSWKIDWPTRGRLIGGLAAAGLLSAGLWGVYFLKPAIAANTPAGELVILEPGDWVGKPFALLDEIDGSAPLRTGRWTVLFYHYDCSDCLAAIPAYRQWAGERAGMHLAFVSMPPVAPAGQEPVTESTAYLRLALRPDHDWFATTPVVATLEDGVVRSAVEGDAAVVPR